MATYVNLTITTTNNYTVSQLNSLLTIAASKSDESAQSVINLINAYLAGAANGTMKLSVTATDPNISGGGGGNSATLTF